MLIIEQMLMFVVKYIIQINGQVYGSINYDKLEDWVYTNNNILSMARIDLVSSLIKPIACF